MWSVGLRAKTRLVQRALVLALVSFNHPATTEVYTLSLHDALPISINNPRLTARILERVLHWTGGHPYLTQRLCLAGPVDRKSTRLNSSHSQNSYAVFCLKKKKYVKCPPALHTRT